MKNENQIKKIQAITVFFMTALAVSGLTAIPVKTEIVWLQNTVPASWGTIQQFLSTIRNALYSCDETILYGFDWLAFAHVVIAILFIGVLRDPVRNIWVVEFGMIACILILPFAFVMGNERGIPLWWQLIDCSFGVFGIIPLWYVRNLILQLEKRQQEEMRCLIF
ncbi:MAG: hypothetical protein KA242_07670 [Chitinophagales bacterium]|nr:hypothetical protein [Chitinophagales bacterium]